MLYRFLIRPLSRLPFPFLYGISTLCYWVLRYVVAYRKQVIERNISIAFPQWTKEKKAALLTESYRHLADILIEGVKNLSISKEKLLDRMHLENPALFEDLYQKGKHVIILSSHIENWEYFIRAQPLLLPHRAFGIGKKMNQSDWNTHINAERQRFGMRVIHAKNYREVLAEEIKGKPLAVLTLGDQSPAPDNAFWRRFFTQETAFAFGAEFMAHEYNMAVVYVRIKKIKRGYYVAESELICESPETLEYGAITNAYVDRLERDIIQYPNSWLWSHKRWKIPIPAQLEDLKKEHEARFNKRFKK